jgi:hypothetical protein
LFEVIRSASDYSFYDLECDRNGHLGGIRRVEQASASSCDNILAVPADRPLR